jgi:hypothetical protein
MATPSSDSETTPVAEAEGKRMQARQWRAARMERFAQAQLRKRDWINFEEVAVLCSELDGSGVPNQAAFENACRNLERDLLLSSDFEENGRSRVLYLHPWTVKTRMTREWYHDAIQYDYDGHRGRSPFLPWCWFSRAMYERWAAKYNLPISPPRFQPEHAVTAVVAQPTASGKSQKAIAKRRRRAEEQIRQELEKKAPEHIDTPGDKTYWSIAGRLVETRGSTRQLEVDKRRKALQRYSANQPKD